MAEPAAYAVLILYKKIVNGDLRKFSATSNDQPNGGGARDLRFSPADKFLPAFEKMFPSRKNSQLYGHFSWSGHGQTEVLVHPPSNSRPNEIRIGCVHECFPRAVVPGSADDCILLLVLDDTGKVWPFFTSEESLSTGGWHPLVRDSLLAGLRAKRRRNITPMGYLDIPMEAVTQMDDHMNILALLERKKNVLLMGAPGAGKSRVMNKAAETFLNGGSLMAPPALDPDASIPLPADDSSGSLDLPMLKKANRKVFRTTMHQNSKYRDFLTGIVPELGPGGGYRVNEGILYRANEFAKQADSAALLIVDELNRGPAIEVFGGSIVAIESDKRLRGDHTRGPSTQYFEILNPADGNMVEYAFSPNLYILAAMNQADASVAPLDVAFLRRWQSYPLKPNYDVLYTRFGVDPSQPLPDTCGTAEDVYSAAIHALEKINGMIAVGRGSEYQLGQGVFLSTSPQDGSKEAALEFVCEVWGMIYAHIEELFFGDSIAIAYLVHADSPLSPYRLQEAYFAGETKAVLAADDIVPGNIFALYSAIAGRDA